MTTEQAGTNETKPKNKGGRPKLATPNPRSAMLCMRVKPSVADAARKLGPEWLESAVENYAAPDATIETTNLTISDK